MLIFVNRIKTARFVAGEVAAAGFRTALLHGDRPQAEREVRPEPPCLLLQGTAQQTVPHVSGPHRS